MSSLFSLFREVLPPSVVTHAVSCSLLAPGARNLVIAKSTVLEIYNVIDQDEETSAVDVDGIGNGHSSSLSRRPTTRKTARLQLLAHRRLHGVITSMAVIRTAVGGGSEGRDSILLSFADAKLSLIEWQPGLHDIITVSIHYYERDEFKSDTKPHRVPKIRSDPSNRCAVMQVYGDKLAVIPVRQSDFGGAGVGVGGLGTSRFGVVDTDMDNVSKHPFYPSFVVPFTQIDAKIKHVIDIAFLDGYFEPTLAILYEPLPSWTGRVAARYDTVNLIVVSLDLSRRNFPILFSHTNLPYNSFELHPLPVSVGGILVLSTNGLIHIDQTSITGVSVSLNPYFGAEEHNEGGMDIGPPTKYGPPQPAAPPLRMDPNPLYRGNMTPCEGLGVRLRSGVCLNVDADTLLLTTMENELLQVDLIGTEDAGRGNQRRKGGVRRFEVRKTGVKTVGVPAVCCNIGESTARQGFAFVATRDTDAMLIRYYDTSSSSSSSSSSKEVVGVKRTNGAEPAPVSNKRVKMEIAEDEDLYGDSDAVATTVKVETNGNVAPTEQQGDSGLRFYVVDNIVSVGPFKDITLSSPAWSQANFPYTPQIPRKDLELLAVSGATDDSGAIVAMRETVTPVIIGSMSDIGFKVKEMWSVRGPMAPDLSESASRDVRDAERYHKYLVMSGEKRKEKVTVVMDASGEELVFTEDVKFFRKGATIDVDTVLAGEVIVQVHTAGLVVLDIAGKRLQEISSDRLTFSGEVKKRTIRMCEIEDPYVLLALSDGELVLLAADSETRQLKVLREIQPSADNSYRTCCLYAYNAKYPRFASLEDMMKRVGQEVGVGGEGVHKVKRASSSASKKGKSGSVSAAKGKKKVTVADDYLDELDRDLYGGGGGAAANQDAEDDDLYGNGDADKDEVMEPVSPTASTGAKDAGGDTTMQDTEAPEGAAGKVYWCATLRTDGELQIYSLPDFTQCFRFTHFNLLPGLLWDIGQEVPRDLTAMEDGEAAPTARAGVDVVEMLMVDFGAEEKDRDVYLIARTETDDLVIYKGFTGLIRSEEGTLDMESLATSFTTTLAGEAEAVLEESQLDFDELHPKHRLATRFVRVEHTHLLRESQFYTDVEKTDKELGEELPEDTTVVRRRYMRIANKLVGFEGSEYQAVFVAGSRPCLISAARSLEVECRGLATVVPPKAPSYSYDDEGNIVEEEEQIKEEELPTKTAIDVPSRRHGTDSLWIHPLTCDGEIKSFAAFNTPAVQHGFVYFNQTGLLRVCQLSPRFDTEFHWPIRKIPLNRTPHHIVNHPASEKFVLTTSKSVNFVLARAQYAAAVTSGVIEYGEEFNGQLPDKTPLSLLSGVDERLPGAFMPRANAYSLELVSPVTWETVDKYDFGEYEVVLDVKSISFESKQTVSGRKLYIVVGTGVQRSEDLAARGKLYVFEVIEVVPEPGRPETNHKFKLMYQTEEKGLPGPVTQLCQVKQYVMAAVGNRLILHDFEDETLNGVAFIDINMYATAAVALRNLMLIGDVRKSIWFMGYQEDPAKIGSLGRDLLPMQVAASEFLIDYTSLYFVVSDDEKNIAVYAFDEKDPTSLGGAKLVRKAEFHVGNRIEKMIRMRKVGLPRKKGGQAPASKQHASLMASADGSLSFIMPIGEKMYRRLLSLNTRLLNALPHPAGLNPRGFRRTPSHVDRLQSTSSMRAPVDGDLLFRFISLPLNRQKELSKSIGSTLEKVMDDLLELENSVDFF